ncbi:MAG: MBL fold metallo-hydrolase [Bellilinea sp.]|nr:MBL fold metallo-hydrolase [Bellilinea sp.]
MTLEILTFSLGPLDNNTYLLVDTATKEAVIVDPTFDSHQIAQVILERKIKLTQIWLTHAHFDHIAGAKLFSQFSEPPLPIGIHRDDLELYLTGGGAGLFGIQMPDMPEPTLFFEHGQILQVGEEEIEVRHTPGHSRGHVIFYAPQANAAIVGDLIFQNGVGRTDLPGGSSTQLLKSIYQQVLTLPPETRLLPGHGPETTVQEEADNNPYLN